MTHNFYCQYCHEHKIHTSELTTGYGRSQAGVKICFACCGILDRKRMGRTGKATLYLEKDKDYAWYVTNWPGTLRFPVLSRTHGRHNIAGTRDDVLFNVDGEYWYGTQYGEWTQICHCKRYLNQKRRTQS